MLYDHGYDSGKVSCDLILKAGQPVRVRHVLRFIGRLLLGMPAAVHAQPYGRDTCLQGFVWREATPGDHVCVSPQARSMALGQNRNSYKAAAPALSGARLCRMIIAASRQRNAAWPGGRTRLRAVASWRRQ
jgi:hypothetical protein